MRAAVQLPAPADNNSGSTGGTGVDGAKQDRRVSLDAFFVAQRTRILENLHDREVRLRRRLLAHDAEIADVAEFER